MNTSLHKSSVWISLLTSGSTLICCAIPAILVLLGAGSVVAALVGTFPQLVWLSEHKIWLFSFGGVMLGVSGLWGRATALTCPTDPVLAKQCRQTKTLSRVIWWLSVVLYGIGFSVSYIAPLFLS
jgi:hypothetical protein